MCLIATFLELPRTDFHQITDQMSDQQITCFDSLNHVDFTDLICCQLEKVNQIDIKEIKFKNLVVAHS